MDIDFILKELELFSEKKYKEFNSKIIPTKQVMLGVRVPILRKMAKRIIEDDAMEFIEFPKHNIYELILLEGIVLSYIDKSFKKLLPSIENYLDKVDNWAQVDSPVMSFKSINKDRKYVYRVIIDKWLKSDEEYILRFALVILLNYFVEQEYLKDIFKLSQEILNKKYYVYMANAWLISVCMVKFPNETICFFKDNTLDKNTHNKAIQKSIESFRVSKENKLIIKKLKISI